MSCVLYRDTNIIVSGLECLHQLLSTANAEFLFWLTSQLSNGQVRIYLGFSQWGVASLETDKISVTYIPDIIRACSLEVEIV